MQKNTHPRGLGLSRHTLQSVGIGAVLIILAALDRFFKMLIEQPAFQNMRIGPRFFAFERFRNLGIAFNIPIPLALVVPISLILLTALYFWIQRTPALQTRLGVFAAGLITIGAISNAVDRVVYGYTIDFFRILDAIVNLADIFVVAGILILLSLTKREQR